MQYISPSSGFPLSLQMNGTSIMDKTPVLLVFPLFFLSFFFFFSSASLWLPTYLPPPSCLCAQLCNPMDCSAPGSSVHGLFQARILGCHFLLLFFVSLNISSTFSTCQALIEALQIQIKPSNNGRDGWLTTNILIPPAPPLKKKKFWPCSTAVRILVPQPGI